MRIKLARRVRTIVAVILWSLSLHRSPAAGKRQDQQNIFLILASSRKCDSNVARDSSLPIGIEFLPSAAESFGRTLCESDFSKPVSTLELSIKALGDPSLC